MQDRNPGLKKRSDSHGSHGGRVSNRWVAHRHGVEVQREGILVIDNSRGEIGDVVSCKRLPDEMHPLRLEMGKLREERLQPFVEIGGYLIKIVDWVGLAGGRKARSHGLVDVQDVAEFGPGVRVLLQFGRVANEGYRPVACCHSCQG